MELQLGPECRSGEASLAVVPTELLPERIHEEMLKGRARLLEDTLLLEEEKGGIGVE